MSHREEWPRPNRNHERPGEIWCLDVAGVTHEAGGPAAIMGFAYGCAFAESMVRDKPAVPDPPSTEALDTVTRLVRLGLSSGNLWTEQLAWDRAHEHAEVAIAYLRLVCKEPS